LALERPGVHRPRARRRRGPPIRHNLTGATDARPRQARHLPALGRAPAPPPLPEDARRGHRPPDQSLRRIGPAPLLRLRPVPVGPGRVCVSVGRARVRSESLAADRLCPGPVWVRRVHLQPGLALPVHLPGRPDRGDPLTFVRLVPTLLPVREPGARLAAGSHRLHWPSDDRHRRLERGRRLARSVTDTPTGKRGSPSPARRANPQLKPEARSEAGSSAQPQPVCRRAIGWPLSPSIGREISAPSGRPILRPPIATFWCPAEWAQVLTGTGGPSGRLRPPHMHTEWRPEEFRALSGGQELDNGRKGSDTPARGPKLRGRLRRTWSLVGWGGAHGTINSWKWELLPIPDRQAAPSPLFPP